MKKFLSDYSFYSVKMLVTQLVVSLFGLMLSMAFSKARSDAGQIISSVFAVLFYLFLIYYDSWNIGYKDKLAVGHGRTDRRPINGLYISLLANSVNIILAVVFAFGVEFCRGIMAFIEGMYAGILAIPLETIQNGEDVSYVLLGEKWWIYFLIVIPTLFISSVSYYFGLRDIRFTSLFNEQSTEKPEKQKKRKK